MATAESREIVVVASDDDLRRKLAAQQAVTLAFAAEGGVDAAATRVLAALGENLGFSSGSLWLGDADALSLAARWRAEDVPETRQALVAAAARAARPQWSDDGSAVAFAARSTGGLVVAALEFAAPAPLAARPRGDLDGFLDVVGWQIGAFLDRASAAQALRESNALRGAILDASLDSVLTISAHGRVTEANAAASRALGHARAELMGRDVGELVRLVEGEAGLVARIDADPAALGTPMRALGIRKDGSTFEGELAVVRLATGTRPTYTLFLRDMTERRRQEVAIRESEARYRFLSEAIPVQVWTATPDGRIDHVNLRVLDALGLAYDEAVGDGWQRALHPDDADAFLAAWRRSVDAGDDFSTEVRLRAADGAWRWHIARAVPQRDEDGRILKWFGTTIDITERKAAEESMERLLREVEMQRQRLDNIVASVPGVVWEAWGEPDAAGHRVDFVSEHVEKMLGYSVAEWLATPNFWLSIVHPDDRERAAAETAALFASGKAGSLEFRWRRKDGTYIWAQAWQNVVVDSGGRPLGMRGVTVDITARKLAEEELRRRAEDLARLAEALERSNRELDQFAYITSHDLKAPLRGIANLSRWIEEDLGDKLSDEARGHMELLRGRVHRMESLIDAILEYSRVGRVRGKTEAVDVKRLVEDAVDLLAPPEGFRVHVRDPMPASLLAERARLQQVFMNLIGNAVKHHARKDGNVWVSAEDLGRMWRFEVRDDGPGIPPRFHEKVFVIFQTLQPRDKVEGTGVGLALVKKIVESQGGTIALESDEGKGAAFRFTWPKEPPEAKRT